MCAAGKEKASFAPKFPTVIIDWHIYVYGHLEEFCKCNS